MAIAGTRAYNGGLGADPPGGQEAKPSEAEKLFSLEHPKEGLFSALFVLSRGLWTVIVDRGITV